MIRKSLSVLLALVMLLGAAVSFSACSDGSKDKGMTDPVLPAPELKVDFTVPDDFKIGFIFLHDENSTYDKNFIDAALSVKKAMNLKDEQVVMKTNVPESDVCYTTAVELAKSGCKVIFADSFGHESYMLRAAKEYPDVQFCHATGTLAHTEKLANYHNAFASIYEGRYLAGIAAGLKLNEMIADGKFKAEEAKIGYVGAYTYAEVISGYTSFYLGAKSVCPTVTMDVQFTGSWYDETAEKNTALALINGGCKLISGHADSMGAPTACEEKGVPNIAYNGSTVAQCPNTFIVSSRIDWAPYFKYICEQAMAGKTIDTDWTGTLKTGSVALTDINEKVAAKDTAAKLKDVRAKLESGELNVFDTNNFTVEGKKVESFKVEKTNEVIENGIFKESSFRSAPYFDLRIDGITLLNDKY